MSSSSRSYSKESRSHYSRSSSSDNKRSSSASRNHRLAANGRPLSSLLVERDFPSPSSFALDSLDDPYFFEHRSRKLSNDFDRRLRYRFNDDFFDDQFFKDDFKQNSFDIGRNIPINYREYNNSSSISRNIPVQYTPSPTNPREKVYKKIDNNDNRTSNSYKRNNESFNARENRISSDDWPSKQESPTRKRTSMTISVRQPYIQYTVAPHHQRTTSASNYSTSNYPPSNRTNYY